MAVADMTGMVEDEMFDSVTGVVMGQEGLAGCLLVLARERGVSVVGLGGLLSQLTKECSGGGVELDCHRFCGRQ